MAGVVGRIGTQLVIHVPDEESLAGARYDSYQRIEQAERVCTAGDTHYHGAT